VDCLDPKEDFKALEEDVLRAKYGFKDADFNQLMSKTTKNGPPKVKVVITQPRRVAAIQMAKRVSYERSGTLGEEVGSTTPVILRRPKSNS